MSVKRSSAKRATGVARNDPAVSDDEFVETTTRQPSVSPPPWSPRRACRKRPSRKRLTFRGTGCGRPA